MLLLAWREDDQAPMAAARSAPTAACAKMGFFVNSRYGKVVDRSWGMARILIWFLFTMVTRMRKQTLAANRMAAGFFNCVLGFRQAIIHMHQLPDEPKPFPVDMRLQGLPAIPGCWFSFPCNPSSRYQREKAWTLGHQGRWCVRGWLAVCKALVVMLASRTCAWEVRETPAREAKLRERRRWHAQKNAAT